MTLQIGADQALNSDCCQQDRILIVISRKMKNQTAAGAALLLLRLCASGFCFRGQKSSPSLAVTAASQFTKVPLWPTKRRVTGRDEI